MAAAIAPADFKAAFSRFQRDAVTDHAAALTYYSMMSLFPALLLGVAVLGLVGQQGLITDAGNYLRDAGAPKDVINAVTAALQSAQKQRGTAVTALILGSASALYGASGAFGAVGRALNHIWRVQEGRGFVKHKAEDLGWTLVLLVLVFVAFVLIFLGGGLAGDVLGVIGLGDTAAALWRILRWPAALLVAMLIYALVYYAAPNAEIRRFRFITPGAVSGVLAWLLASGLFFVYASNFSSYGATYGSFATVVVLLVWIWLTNVALLFGAELNAVVDLRRSPELPPGYDGPLLAPKDPPDD
ncbi:MAG: rane protein [Solirubrobacteraceae bacterium]|jgi:membrane protein|nr:rane protein [Solirubrobacteraceae bacterium]